jgi:hypothetical protein
MTTYSYRITLNDREVIALKEALMTYLELCDTGRAERPDSKVRPHPRAIRGILERLDSDTRMTSTSSSCWPQKDRQPE